MQYGSKFKDKRDPVDYGVAPEKDHHLIYHLTEEFIKSQEEPDSAEVGWYFVDEVELLCGPYSSKEEALQSLSKYLRELLEKATGWTSKAIKWRAEDNRKEQLEATERKKQAKAVAKRKAAKKARKKGRKR